MWIAIAIILAGVVGCIAVNVITGWYEDSLKPNIDPPLEKRQLVTPQSLADTETWHIAWEPLDPSCPAATGGVTQARATSADAALHEFVTTMEKNGTEVKILCCSQDFGASCAALLGT